MRPALIIFLIAVVVLAIIIPPASACNDKCQLPKPSFTISQHKGVAPLTVHFISTSRYPAPGKLEIVKYMWKYNDGTGWKIFSEATQPYLTLTKKGRYDISLMVTNDCGSVTKTKHNAVIVR